MIGEDAYLRRVGYEQISHVANIRATRILVQEREQKNSGMPNYTEIERKRFTSESRATMEDRRGDKEKVSRPFATLRSSTECRRLVAAEFHLRDVQ